jgi:hypothetical protein
VVECDVALAIFNETDGFAKDGVDATSVAVLSGMGLSTVSYNFPLGDNFTESVTLVGNDCVWVANPGTVISGVFTETDSPPGTGGVQRRENLKFDYTATTTDINGMVADADATILPPDIYGISNSGTNEEANDKYGAHVGDITVTVNSSRSPIFEQGRRGAYARRVDFPVQVSTDINVTTTSGDRVSATEAGILGGTTCENSGNLTNRTIRIATCEGTRLYMGTKNKRVGINYGGGDAGGGNASVTYSFQTFNALTVLHPNDPNGSGSTWWTNREDYLLNTGS